MYSVIPVPVEVVVEGAGLLAWLLGFLLNNLENIFASLDLFSSLLALSKSNQSAHPPTPGATIFSVVLVWCRPGQV